MLCYQTLNGTDKQLKIKNMQSYNKAVRETNPPCEQKLVKREGGALCMGTLENCAGGRGSGWTCGFWPQVSGGRLSRLWGHRSGGCHPARGDRVSREEAWVENDFRSTKAGPEE